MPRIVCEGDEPGAIQVLISAGLGIGLNPAFARRIAEHVPIAWVDIDSPDCRRTLTLVRSASGHLSAGARLMRDTIAGWDWNGGEAAA